MKLWLINIDELGGEEHNILVAAKSLNDKQAINYAIRYLKKVNGSYKYDETDLERIEYKEVNEVSGLSEKIEANSYVVKVHKKGFLYDWFNFKRG